MKINRSLLILLLPLTLVFSSCKKDKDEAKNSFTYEGKTYATTHAFGVNEGNYLNLMFTSTDLSQTNTSGKISMVNILMSKPELIAGTFTYKSDTDPNFDESKHFFDAAAYLDLTVQNGTPDENSGTIVEGITTGRIIVAKSGSNYTISYELNFNGSMVSGKYSGTIQMN